MDHAMQLASLCGNVLMGAAVRLSHAPVLLLPGFAPWFIAHGLCHPAGSLRKRDVPASRSTGRRSLTWRGLLCLCPLVVAQTGVSVTSSPNLLTSPAALRREVVTD